MPKSRSKVISSDHSADQLLYTWITKQSVALTCNDTMSRRGVLDCLTSCAARRCTAEWYKPQSRLRDCGLNCTVRKPTVDAHRPLRPAAWRATNAPSQPRPLPTVARVATRRPRTRSQRQLRRPYKAHASVWHRPTDARDYYIRIQRESQPDRPKMLHRLEYIVRQHYITDLLSGMAFHDVATSVISHKNHVRNIGLHVEIVESNQSFAETTPSS